MAVGAEHFFHFGAKMIDNTSGTYNVNITLSGYFVVEMRDVIQNKYDVGPVIQTTGLE